MAGHIQTRHPRSVVMLAVLILSLVWSFGGLGIASADDSGAICVLRIASQNHPILTFVVDQPENFNIAVPVPPRKAVNVPVLCDLLETLAIGMANQGNSPTHITVSVFSNQGILVCSKGPFAVAAHGSQGMIFSDCQ